RGPPRAPPPTAARAPPPPPRGGPPPPIEVAPGRGGARQAQDWLRGGRYQEAAEGFLSAARGADPDEAETYRYNAGYAYYRGGDTDKAIQTLRPLLMSKRNGARAGELIGKMALEKLRSGEVEKLRNGEVEKSKSGEVEKSRSDLSSTSQLLDSSTSRLAALEEAATAFQRALRDDPGDERRNRNFTRGVWQLPEAREAAHIESVMKEHGQTPPDQLMGTMLAEQRALIDGAYVMFTNDAPALIRTAEALAKRQDKQADLWIPLKQHIMQAVTNQQQQAQFAQQVELARDSMKGAAEALRDILPASVSEVAQPEALVYNFWKAVAPPPALVDEAIICQSNAIQKLEARYLMNRDTQPEALQLTQMFRERFPEWAQQYLSEVKSQKSEVKSQEEEEEEDTSDIIRLTSDFKKIEELAEHAEKLLQEILDAKTSEQDRPALKSQVLADLYEIRELLPKQQNQNQQQQQDQQQNQQDQQQEQDQQENKDDQQENPDDQQKEEQQEEEQKQEEQQQEEKQEETPRDVQELLRRALEREKEHEDEQKKRMQQMPMSLGKDW
ncbi:MAG: tetratricopeptide repeat protein, partial [Kiritimatiellaeota bacterium]|nr:tetratricopeptide repeat protein [Kiritimatiellota bacterium]